MKPLKMAKFHRQLLNLTLRNGVDVVPDQSCMYLTVFCAEPMAADHFRGDLHYVKIKA